MQVRKTSVIVSLTLDWDLYQTLLKEAASRQSELGVVVEEALRLWAESKRSAPKQEIQEMIGRSKILEALIEAFTAPIPDNGARI